MTQNDQARKGKSRDQYRVVMTRPCGYEQVWNVNAIADDFRKMDPDCTPLDFLDSFRTHAVMRGDRWEQIGNTLYVWQTDEEA